MRKSKVFGKAVSGVLGAILSVTTCGNEICMAQNPREEAGIVEVNLNSVDPNSYRIAQNTGYRNVYGMGYKEMLTGNKYVIADKKGFKNLRVQTNI
ncbi:hypothetical protein FACS189481_0010 [Clostridia bacterium]|nr:hypothetical protein FACS189481_0010 [Clostridia bacterium]